jgi:hypothetical protein
MTERIGTDILGYQATGRMSEKKKKELEAKLKEEKAKKEQETEQDDKQKLPDLPIPNDQHNPKPGEHGWDKVEEEAKEAIHVNEHTRGRPKKRKREEQSPFIEVV